jgi:quercetin dioxygenase-like cupin family protein
MRHGVARWRPDDASWSEANIYGTVLPKSAIFEGDHGVRSAFFKMMKGDSIAKHLHRKWVQVAVISGRMLVEQEGAPAFAVSAGDVYFIDPGFPHTETAAEDSLLLVTQGEDRPGWE